MTLHVDTLKELFSHGGEEQLAKYFVRATIEVDGRRGEIVDIRRGSHGYTVIKIDDEIFLPRYLLSAQMNLSAAQVEKLANTNNDLWSLFNELFEKQGLAKQARIEEVMQCVLAGNVGHARKIYDEHCASGWPIKEFEQALNGDALAKEFVALLKNGQLNSVDRFYWNNLRGLLSVESIASLKTPRIKRQLSELAIEADDEQVRALASPFARVQIQARAGSGKTRTLSARGQ